ncbi:MAG: hypothetical protein ACLQVF_18125 [Isosphaeraceae bacterium]
MLGFQFSKVLAVVLTVFVAFLLAMASATATFLAGRYLAARLGMGDVEYLRDSIVASSAIVIHLTVDRFLDHAWRSTRCLRASALSLIRKFLSKR